MQLELQKSDLRWPLIALLASLVACSASGSGGGKAEPQGNRALTIFITGELKGQIEPCGCTTDPLGDIARTARLVSDTRAGGHVIYIDAGSTLYTHNPVPPELAAQEDLKAKLLLDALEGPLQPAAMGLGPYDLSRGAKAVAPPRMAANISKAAGVPLQEPQVIDIDGAKIGLFGVVSPEAVKALGIEASPPAPSAQRAIADLRQKGARLIIGIAHMTKSEARTLASEAPGADILVVGQNLPAPERIARGPDRVGDTFLVSPAEKGQVVTRLDVTLRSGSPLHDAIGKARAVEEIEAIDAEAKGLAADLERWSTDPNADKSFVATKTEELAELRAKRDRLAKEPTQVPKAGPYFVMEQVRIRKALPCNAELVAAKATFDKAAGEANLAAAKGVAPPAAPEGKAGYAGIEECSYCHDKEVAFWKDTRHAHAWKSLTDAGKELNRDCIYCHVTGFDKPGGSNLGYNEPLREVQCEVCHGPGSIHVENEGNERPFSVTKEPTEDFCTGCHTPEHSDTFDFKAYLRDVTGPGHGEAFRKKLGDGPTGRELRSAGLKKAGADIGDGCPK